MPGTVKLYYYEECLISVCYVCPKQRKEIIKSWEKLYGEKIKDCAIQISPIVREMINEKGGNLRAKQVPVELKIKEERPPAVYDNPSYV